jgi:hypothetical protein
MPWWAVFFSFLTARFSFRFLPGFFFSLPRGCLDPIRPAYADTRRRRVLRRASRQPPGGGADPSASDTGAGRSSRFSNQ